MAVATLRLYEAYFVVTLSAIRIDIGKVEVPVRVKMRVEAVVDERIEHKVEVPTRVRARLEVVE